MRGFMESAGLLLPFFAPGAVFEGQQLAEGPQLLGVPPRDLPPGADAVGMKLPADDLLDALDPRQVVIRHGGEGGGIFSGAPEHADEFLQAPGFGRGGPEPLPAFRQAATRQGQRGRIRRRRAFEFADAPLPALMLLGERGGGRLMRGQLRLERGYFSLKRGGRVRGFRNPGRRTLPAFRFFNRRRGYGGRHLVSSDRRRSGLRAKLITLGTENVKITKQPAILSFERLEAFTDFHNVIFMQAR